MSVSHLVWSAFHMHMMHTKSLALKCQKSDHIHLHETAHKITLFQLFKSITAGVAEMSTP